MVENIPERPRGVISRLKQAAVGIGSVLKRIPDVFGDLSPAEPAKPIEPSGWMEEDDPDMQFLGNGAPYNR